MPNLAQEPTPPGALDELARRPSRSPGPNRVLITQIDLIITDRGFTIQRRQRPRAKLAHPRQIATGLMVNQKSTRRAPRAGYKDQSLLAMVEKQRVCAQTT
jgi:hypothetical protein